MARILVVDSNPDTQRALRGLLKYRTRHTFEMVTSCTQGARRAVATAPDVIMVNALLFMGNNYAFPRVLQQNTQTAGISFLVHTPGDVGEVTRRQIEASGVAGVVEMPISAEELDAEIVAATGRSHTPPADAGGVRPVQWQRISKSQTNTESQEVHKGKAVKSVQWQSISTEEAKHSGITKGRKPVRENQTQTSKDENPRIFRSLADTSSKAQAKPSGFQAASFQPVDSEDAVKNKKPATFKEQTWNDADPDETVKRPKR